MRFGNMPLWSWRSLSFFLLIQRCCIFLKIRAVQWRRSFLSLTKTTTGVSTSLSSSAFGFAGHDSAQSPVLSLFVLLASTQTIFFSRVYENRGSIRQ